MTVRIKWILLFFLGSIGVSFGQQYEVTYSVQPNIPSGVTYLGEDIDITIDGIWFENQPISGWMIVNSAPSNFFITVTSYVEVTPQGGISFCGSGDNIPINGTSCSAFSTTFNDVGCSFTVYVAVRPYDLSLSADILPNGVKCASTPIALTAESGYAVYNWEYRREIGGWVSLGSSTSSIRNVNKSELGGLNFNENVYFRYSSNCGFPYSNEAGPFKFRADQIFASSSTTVKPTCLGGNDGSLTISLSRPLIPGIPSESYTPSIYSAPNLGSFIRNGTSNSPLIDNLPAGNYYVLVESSFGNCGLPDFRLHTVQAGPRTPITASVAINNVTCNGLNNGQITVSNVNGGNGNYQFNLNGGTFGATNVFSSLSPGVYTIGIKDNCATATERAYPSLVVDQPSAITISPPPTPTLCNGTNNGQISISASGGTGALQYSINNGANYFPQTTFTSLAPGSYPVRVKDSNNCETPATSVLVPSPLVAGTVSITQPLCNGGTGSINVIGTSGGVGPYTYSIPGYAPRPIGTPITNVSSGSYVVTIRDINNCTTTTTAVINNPPLLTINTVTKTDPACFATPSGSITINASGGTGTLEYSINGGGNFQASNIFSNVVAGVYAIRVRDINNCIQSTSITLNNPPALVITSVSTTPQSCTSINDGSITVLASGGTGALQYSIGGAFQSGNVFSNLTSGPYTVTVRDANNCTVTITTAVTILSPVTAAISIPATNGFAILCKGGFTGSINITPSGGTAPYTFQWYKNNAVIPGAVGLSEDLVNQGVGSYKVVITDSKGCSVTTSDQILNEPNNNISFTSTNKTDITCFGANNGTITVAATGGTGGIEYSINGGAYQISNVFSALTPGGYVVTARDANGCTQNTASINITSPAAALSITTITKTDPLCNGTSNGSFTIVATGGTAPYQYSSNGSTYVSSNVLSGLSANTYTLRVRDANGCIVNSSSQTLSNPAVLSFNTTSTTPQSCATVVDGTISVNAIGGTGTKQYSINGSTFQSSGIFNALSAGNYTVTVRDANMCTSATPVTVGSVTAIDGTISQTGFINCFGQSTAALSINATGGTSPYTYAWSNGSTTTSATGLPAASHSVIITDIKGCSTTKSLTVTQPAQLATSLTQSNYNGFGVSCVGSSNGFINQTVTGGTSPYIYTWSNGAAIKDIASLSAGLYNVTVNDSRGCTTTGSATLVAPSAISVSLNIKEDVSCFDGNDGSLSMLGSGGTGIYNYSNNAGITWQPSPVFSTLDADNYTILVRDQNMCQAQTIVSITQPVLLTVAVNNVIDATCGNANGSAVALGSGGTGNITYTWRNANNDLITNTAALSNVGSGTYTILVQDQNTCTTSSSVAISSTDGAQFSVSAITGVTCPTSLNGSAQVVIDNGQSPFTTSWSNGESGLSAVALAGGTNSVTVRDGNGCEVNRIFIVPAPTPINVNLIQITPPLCPGTNTAAVQVQVTGGTGAYNYTWDGIAGGASLSNILPGTYQLRVQDASSCELNEEIVVQDLSPITIDVVSQNVPTCATSTDGIITVQAQGGNGSFTYNWSNNATGSQITNISGGDYEVSAVDLNGCTATQTINLSSPDAVVININEINEISCNGLQDGSLTTIATGGTGSHEYSINNGQSWQSESSFTNLAVNNYTLLGRDENGCTASTTVSITQPSPLTVNITGIESTTCNNANGSATGNSGGGTGDYAYEWINSANQIVSNSAILTGASAGSYFLRVYDENQCIVTSDEVTINSSTASVIEVASIEMTSCVDTEDGEAILNIISGPGPHTVLWGNGETGFSATQLQAGTNTVSVTDGDACVVTTTFQVPAPIPVILSSQNLINPSCPGTASGAIQVLATGGAGNYSYSWNGNPGGNGLQNIPAGTYNLLVTDAQGCTLNQALTLIDLPTIEIATNVLIPPTCAGGNDGQISVTATGANESFTYSWSNGFEGAIINAAAAGNYQVTATDQLGCSSSLDLVLVDPPPFVFDLGPDRVICVGQTLVVSAPVDNGSYAWSTTNGTVISTSKEVTITQAGDYTLLITNADGCDAQDSFRVTTSNALLTADFLAVSEAHEGDSILLIDISWPLPETIEWIIPAEARVIERTNDYATIIFSQAGIYGLSVTARLGQCVSTYSRPITILSKNGSVQPGGRQSTDDPLIKVFTAYPNPNQGDFKVSIELGEPEVITLRLISLNQDLEVWRADHSETMQADFEVKPDNLPIGLYFLILTVKDQTRMIRIIRN